MPNYVITGYRDGVEPDQARIGCEVARNWIWPYAYNLEDLLQVHRQPDFDPDIHHYCYLQNEMVGYISASVSRKSDDNAAVANLDFPRVMSGHERAADLLLEQAFQSLRKKGVSRVIGRVTTMCPEDIRLAERAGFRIYDWGYKAYYSYEMKWGRLDIPCDSVEETDVDKDLTECAQLASLWYKRSPEWCLSTLKLWHEAGVITHLGVHDGEKLIAACMVAPNDLRPSTAAIYYIFTPDESSLRSMLAKVIDNCVDYGTHNLIADLINEQKEYEPVYESLGFKRVAEWARCEKTLV